MRQSRYYQNWLQVSARSSALFLYLSGAFFNFDKSEIFISLLFLVFNIITGYVTSHLRYRRMQVVVCEVEKGIKKKLRSSKYYQNFTQLSGRGKDVLIFFNGLLLGKGYVTVSLIFLCILSLNGFLTSEFMYYREQAVIREREK